LVPIAASKNGRESMWLASPNEHWPTLSSVRNQRIQRFKTGRVMRDERFESSFLQRSVMQIIGPSAAEPRWKSTIGGTQDKRGLSQSTDHAAATSGLLEFLTYECNQQFVLQRVAGEVRLSSVVAKVRIPSVRAAFVAAHL
jgi:hypothetical protein